MDESGLGSSGQAIVDALDRLVFLCDEDPPLRAALDRVTHILKADPEEFRGFISPGLMTVIEVIKAAEEQSIAEGAAEAAPW